MINKTPFPDGTIVLGGKGMTGYYIDDGVPNYDLVDGNDITVPGVLEKIFEMHHPKYVLLLAAETDVRASENGIDHTFDINTRAAYWTAKLCKEYGSQLYFISSVDVFDGDKDSPYEPNDEPNPIVVYGHSKVAAEGAIKAILPTATIVRAGWMFGGFERDKKFISYVVRDLKAGKPFRAVDDRIGSPTYAKDLIDFLRVMIEFGYPLGQTYHFCCTGFCTRYDQAKVVARELIGNENAVAPCLSSEFPNYRSLKNATMIPSVLTRGWEEALVDYINDWKNE